MDKPDREAIREIVRRRFGSRHDKPCERPETLTCAIWECQVRDRCVHAPAVRALSEQEAGTPVNNGDSGE